MTPHDRANPASEPTDDRVLKRVLTTSPPGVDPARVEALERRVIAQWHEAHAGRSATAVAGVGVVWLAGWGTRRTWVAGATGLAVGLALLVGTWLRSSDPALDDLLQPDVLSQMAAGEM